MAKQSPADPRFRCNECKDYYSAPEHKVHYQCPVHGYLCEQHIVKSGDSVINYVEKDTGDEYVNWTESVERKDSLNKFVGNCKLPGEGEGGRHYAAYNVIGGPHYLKKAICLKNPVKSNWHEDVSRWIEEGREEEEKAKAKPKAKSKTKPDYAKEIKVLVDLLEDDTLTKEVFIKKNKGKTKVISLTIKPHIRGVFCLWDDMLI